MRLLAIETSTMLGGAAILDGDTLIAESRMNVRVTHSERIMVEIDHMLKQSALTLDDMDIFGISIGPGSFTGLRVGLSTVKGLAYATGKRLVSVSTLEAFAWNIPFSKYQVCPLLDARRKEVYAAIFKWAEGGFVKVREEQPVKIDTLLSEIDEPTIFLGEGALVCRSAITDKLAEKAFFGQPQQMVPSPSNVAYLCMKKAVQGDFADPVSLVPAYLRKSEAEIKLAHGS